jgi:outer membrane biosynthesis protein TonB
MARLRTIVVGALLASLLMLSGCKKKKPPVPAPQAQAPTITEPEKQPAETKPAEPTIAEPQPAPPPETKPSPAVTAPKPKPRVTTKKKTEKPGGKIVVQEGGKQDPTPPPLTAGTSHDEAAQQRLSTAQLIQTTEYNVRSITRALSTEEQAIVQHIRGYVEQSKQATKDGDTERAYNLAIKAHLLSDSLKK